MSFFADEAAFVVSEAPILHGVAAIREGFKAAFARAGPAPVFTPGQIWESGELVSDVGTYLRDGEPPEGGKYVVVWQRQPDGSLKALVDMSVADH